MSAVPATAVAQALRAVHPLWSREKLYYHLVRRLLGHGLIANPAAAFSNASLEFAPTIALELKPGDVSHEALVFCGFYELGLSRLVAKLARRGGVIVDVGANYGYYTALWLAASPLNRSVSIEPHPENRIALKGNLERNQLAGKTTIVSRALGAATGSACFWAGPDGQTGWGGFSTQGQSNTFDVTVTTLDSLATDLRLDRIAFLKIDTEGADTWVLAGAQQLLKEARVACLAFERNWPRMSVLGIRRTAAEELLVSCGYRIRQLSPTEFLAWPACKRPGLTGLGWSL